VIFFFPEKVVPDHFYTSLDRYVDFNVEEFLPYRIELDDCMQWVHKMQEIIKNNPQPRKDRSHIPPRPLVKEQDIGPDVGGPRADGNISEDDGALEGDNDVDEGHWLAYGGRQTANATAKKRPAVDDLKDKGAGAKKKKLSKKALKKLDDKKHSRELYRDAMVRGHRRFFYSVMTQCAKRGRGLLIELARNGPPGDFGFCRYRWTEAERNAFLKYSHVPAAAYDLSADMPIIAIFYYCRHGESWFTGPKIAPKHFERLNLSASNSIIMWDISGPDVVIGPQSGANGRPLLSIVPSEDFQPTVQQKAKIESNSKKLSDNWETVTPSISSMLNTGLVVTDYNLPRMPMDPACDWSSVWSFLNDLSLHNRFEHPRGFSRDSKVYRQPLRAINQELAQYWDARTRTESQDSESGDDEVTAIGD
jgi:hypothetical protein